MSEGDVGIGRPDKMVRVMCLAAGSMEWSVGSRLLRLSDGGLTGFAEQLTQKEISYTRAAFFNKESASRICLNVSIVLGCMPSALPVEVFSGLSSRITTSIPKRTRLHLTKGQYHLDHYGE